MHDLAAPTVDLAALAPALRERGFAVLSPTDFAAFAHADVASLDDLRGSWRDLPPDAWLKDGGRYRKRRHASFVVSPDASIEAAPHRAHWQPVEYNALHGGLERWFEPVEPAVASNPAWRGLLVAMAATAAALRGHAGPWFVEAHQFRIDTEGGIGRPTPEGAHRDGVDLVAVVLIDRVGIKGGETRVFDAHGPAGVRFTMTEPWTCLLLDDARVVHETTPIQPLDVADSHRDTLVVTARAGGFQGPDATADAAPAR